MRTLFAIKLLNKRRSTTLTSNRPIEEKAKLLSDVPAASALRSAEFELKSGINQGPLAPTNVALRAHFSQAGENAGCGLPPFILPRPRDLSTPPLRAE
jgi:hypothetical protein